MTSAASVRTNTTNDRPGGAPSPVLLSNVYIRRFVLG